MSLRVRQAAMSDLETVAQLFNSYREFYKQPPDIELARSFVQERMALLESVIFLAEKESGEVVGFTQLYPSFSSVSACRIWVLNDLFVAAPARGQGVAHALLDAARSHAINTGAKRLDLSTAHDNPAQKLYESLGYERDTGFYHYSLGLE